VGKTGTKRIQLVEGFNFVGAASERGPVVIFATGGTVASAGEVSLPDLTCDALMASGLQPDALYELSFSGPNVSSSPAPVPPGVLADTVRLRANNKGVLRLEKQHLSNLHLRIARI
jgi:hypothetical protein